MQRLFTDIVHLHDKAFRHALTFPRFCNSLLQMILPESYKKELELDGVRLLRDTFVNQDLEKIISDSIFFIPCKDSVDFIVAIVEHQSTHDDSMILRIGDYKQAVIKAAFSERKKEDIKSIPYIHAIVLYHGIQTYNAVKNLAMLTRNPHGWSQSLDGFSYDVFNLHEMSDETFTQNDWAGALCFVFKHIRDRNGEESLLQLLKILDNLTGQDSAAYKSFVLQYFCSGTDIIPRRFDEIFSRHNRSTYLEDQAMTLVQRWAEEGRQEGRQEIMQKMMDMLRREGADPKLLELASQLTGETETSA